MSIGAGGMALRRIRVLKSPLEMKMPWVVDKLKKQMVSPIAIDEAREQSSGWCHPFSGEGSLGDAHKLTFENAFIFGMRTDSKKLPGTLFRLQLKSAFEELAKTAPSDKQGKPRLSKKMKDAVRDRIKDELLRRTLPNIRLVEIVWHLDSGEVWVLSASNSVIEEFEKLFNETFAVPFVHVNPGTTMVDFDRITAGLPVNLDKYMDLTPVSIVNVVESENVNEGTRARDLEAPF